MHKTFVIAELGASWNSSLEDAEALIKVAVDAGASACKFQWTSDPHEMAKRRKASAEAQAMYAKYLAYPIETLLALKDLCTKAGIEFMVTTFIDADIQTVSSMVERFKVSAFESGNNDFIRHHVRYDKDIIVSINPTYLPLPRTQRLRQIKLLHCISKYPAKLDELYLSRINEFDLDGYSDHSGDPITGGIAVAAGAGIVEAHIKLDTTPIDNPDYPHSLTPDEFGQYMNDIRTVEKML